MRCTPAFNLARVTGTVSRAWETRAPIGEVRRISSVASSVASVIRGGAIDMDRSIIRLDALGAYPVVAALVSR